jgi:hypothetical protein
VADGKGEDGRIYSSRGQYPDFLTLLTVGYVIHKWGAVKILASASRSMSPVKNAPFVDLLALMQPKGRQRE